MWSFLWSSWIRATYGEKVSPHHQNTGAQQRVVLRLPTPQTASPCIRSEGRQTAGHPQATREDARAALTSPSCP